jgi:hypothetical protein
MLLEQDSVRKELKLSADQINKVEEVSQKVREKFQEVFGLKGEERSRRIRAFRGEVEKAIAEVLKPEQMKRLKQISYQMRGGPGFTEPEVAKALALTETQKMDIERINRDTSKLMGQLIDAEPDSAARDKKIRAQRNAGYEQVIKLLTEEQKAKWKELQGKLFKGEIHLKPPGGR